MIASKTFNCDCELGDSLASHVLLIHKLGKYEIRYSEKIEEQSSRCVKLDSVTSEKQLVQYKLCILFNIYIIDH